MTCEGCETRRGLYINGCPRCEARMLARGPQSEVDRLAGMTPELRVLIDEERERDAMVGEWWKE